MKSLSRLVAFALVAVLLAGCASRDAAAPGPAPQDPGPARQEPGRQGGTGGSGEQPNAPSQGATPASEKNPPKELITPAQWGAVEHRRFQPGEVLGRLGLYAMDAATGAVEGWVWHDGSRLYQATISPDSRWVMMRFDATAYLYDRRAEKGYQWPYDQLMLVAAQGDALLLNQNGTLWLTDGALERWTALSPSGINAQAIFTGDGQALFLLSGEKIYHVAVKEGTLTELGEVVPSTADSYRPISLRLARGGAEVVLIEEEWRSSPAPFRSARIRRFGADGRLLADQRAPAAGHLSPDGRLIAWEDGGVVVASAADMAPLFRVLGADLCAERVFGSPWLADGSGVIIRTRWGYRVATADGKLTDLGALDDTDHVRTPVPSPARADRIAVEAATVVDRDGRVIARAVTHGEGQWFGTASQEVWSLAGDEVRFSLINTGKGPRCGSLDLDPVVERPPFAANDTYLVNLDAGDCLNLRTGPTTAAPPIACLPGGSRLTRTESPGHVNKGWIQHWGSDFRGEDGRTWIHVKTEDSRRGWIAFDPAYLAWAPAEEGEAPADPLAAAIEDEVARFDYWLAVALGEIPCTTCYPDPSFENAALGLIHRCSDKNLIKRFREHPSYDAAIHGPALDGMAEICRIIRSAHGQLGHPQEGEAWQAELRKARATLPR